MSLLKPFFTVSGFTLLSRITGFVRDILMASILGAGPLVEAFLVAFKLPNFFRRLFGEGAFNAAFVPLYAGKIATDGKEEANVFASQAFSVLFSFLFLFTIIMEMAMPWVMMALAPGFVSDPAKFEIAVQLSRITFPYLLFISLVSLMAGALNSIGKFAAVAAAPILLNLSMIAALVGFTSTLETPVHALAYGVSIAGLLQFIWLYYACTKSAVAPKCVRPKMTSQIRLLLKRMVPGIIGGGIVQINLWVDVLIGTWIPSAIAYLYYADRINQLPLAIFGTAVGTVLLPMLSKQIKQADIKESLNSQNRALELGLFFTIPAAVAFMVIADLVVAALLGRGEFGDAEVYATSLALIVYALGLPGFVLVKIFGPAFFARGDTKTPVKIALLSLFTNILLNIGFVMWFSRIGVMPHLGLALATSISTWLNVVLLFVILRRKEHFVPDSRLKKHSLYIVFSSVVMAGALYGCRVGLEGRNIDGELARVLHLLAIILCGKIIFIMVAYVTGIFRIQDWKQYLSRR